MPAVRHLDIVTTGFDEDAILRFHSGGVVNHGNLTTSGQLADGVFVLADQVTVQNFGNISASGDGAFGVIAFGDHVAVKNHGTIDARGEPVDLGDGIFFTGDGIDVYGNDARIDNFGLISTHGEASSAIFVVGDGATVRNQGTATSEGGFGATIALIGVGNRFINDGTVANTSGLFSVAVVLAGANSSAVNNGHLVVTGDLYAVGIFLGGGLHESAINNGDITASNRLGFGMAAAGPTFLDPSHDLRLVNSGTIATSGVNGVGMLNGAPRFDDIPGVPHDGPRWAPSYEGRIENSGVVTTTGAGSPGVVMANYGGTIVNSGRIETWGGLDASGPMGPISSSGVIATGFQLFITNTRTGVILTHDAASAAVQINVVEGVTPAIAGSSVFENYGEIRSPGAAILGGEVGEIVRNYGALSGRVDMGGGDDTYVAGAGGRLDGVLITGAGHDRVMLENGSGLTIIGDFQAGPGAGDVLDVHAFFHNLNGVLGAARQVGGDVLITLDRDDSVRLVGASLSSLSGDDFLF